MTSRVIRDLEPDDIESLQALDRVAHGEPWSFRTFVDEIERAERAHLVAVSNGAIVGHAAAWFDHQVCRVTNVAVEADASGQGHASALLVSLLNRAVQQPSILNMQLEVRPTNRRAQRLYSRFGFVPIGIDRDFYDTADQTGNRDALVMAVADVCSSVWRDRLKQLTTDCNTEAAA